MGSWRSGDGAGGRRRREAVVLGVILVVGLVLRTAYLLEVLPQPEFSFPAVDAGYHHYWARALATGDWSPPRGEPHPHIESTPYFRPPGYPYFLAAAYRVLGAASPAPRVLQAALGLLNCVLGFLLARRIFGSGVGFLLAGLMATYWSFIYFEAELLEPVVVILLSLLLLMTLERWARVPTFASVGAAGALAGLCALVRPNVLLFAAAVLPWSWSAARRRGLGGRRWAAMATVGLAAGGLAVLPATVRNIRVSGEPVAISANGGINLFLGNNPQADGRVAGEIPGLGPFADCFDYPAIVRSLGQQLGRPLGYAEASRVFRDRALEYMRAEPGRTLSLLVRKTALFWGPHEVSHNREDEIVREESKVLSLIPGGFPFAAAGFVLGLLMLAAERRWADSRGPGARSAPAGSISLVLMFVGAYFASHLPFFVAGRYRVPVVPFLLLFAAVALHRIGEAALDRRWRTVVPALLAGAVLLAAFSLNPAGYLPSRANHEVMRGLAFTASGDLKRSAEAYARALQYDPGHVFARLNLGGIYLRLGENDLARASYEAVIDAQPSLPHPRYNLGLLAELDGDPAAAARHFAEALRMMPSNVETQLHLAAALATLGETEAAARLYRRVLEYEPGRADAREALDALRQRRR